ncbi:MAG TPA: CocE/NonD family hydrolase, partial [Mycobacterium sp.]|uniref:alpha/beta hydrolase family protein n=1 Tax=Mycobacterium sp. TaxID=1785 RepID=UPI002D28B332
MRGLAMRLAVPAMVLAGAAFTASSASATTLPSSFTASCPTQSPSGASYGGVGICSGEVPSFDGATLDVDLTQPVQDTGTTHPLIIMLHGFGNNKHEWESTTDEGDGADKYHWNNHWFAEHGYYVLTYTARGFRDDGTYAAYQPDTPSFTSVSAPNGTIHVKSRDYEIRDTQWLAALVAATYPDVDPNRVAVTGGSYGGGESWMQASQATWDFPHSVDSTLPVLQLQVAIPKYPWTDLAYALAPNGHGGGPSGQDIYESSQAQPDTQTGWGPPGTANPLGVPKLSWVTGLFADGSAKGVFDEGTDVPPPSDQDCPAVSPPGNCEENIPVWNTRITATGDPYDVSTDPILQQAARGLTVLRSAYYQDAQWHAELAGREVAVFSIQGWTDDLFEPVESFRMFKYLKRLDPLWPVEVAVADVGHSLAQNKPDTWHRLNDQAWQFLQSQINGSHREQTTVSSEPTICSGEPGQPSASTPADDITATTPEGLSHGALTITYGGGSHTLTNYTGFTDPNGPATDPIVSDVIEPGQGCRTDRGPALGGYTGYSQPLPDHLTYVGLGEVDIPYTLSPMTTQAQIDARVWDLPPGGGPAYLMTRGTYRIDTLDGYDSFTGTLRLPLYGNDWLLAPGHEIRLDLTQVDQPYLRPNNLPSSISYGSPILIL